MENELGIDENLNLFNEIFENAKVYYKRKLLLENEIYNELEFFEKHLSKTEEAILRGYMSLDDLKKHSDYFRNKTFPNSYINFLKFCNISEMENGERYFQFLSLKEIREYTISYLLPKWMEGGITFAMNGGGCHYIFDMRQKSINGEYPIYASNSGNLCWTDAVFLGNSFLEAITAKTNIEDLF